MWYGKAPGLDRASDALRHGNFVGVSRTGGALAVVGDDPSCKSSTIPSASESLLASLRMPTFFPGNAAEVIDLGLHAYACSRASGLWSGFKIVTSVADALGTADVAPGRVDPVLPDLGYEHVPNGNLLPPASLELERSLLGVRTDLALAYARENGVNRIEGARDAWFGIVAAGKPYYDLMHALRSLGLGERELERVGIRVLKLGMIWPFEQGTMREFGRGLDEILVVEEKGPFIETQLKEALYGSPDAPRIVGKRDEQGDVLMPMELDVDADLIARAVAGHLRRARPGARLRPGPPAPARRDRLPPLRAADGPARAVLLLGLPAQLLDQGARGHARGGGDRLPHDGPAQPRGQRARSPGSRRWAARAPSGSARRRSPTTATLSRTWATAPSTTRARWPCARRSPRA